MKWNVLFLCSFFFDTYKLNIPAFFRGYYSPLSIVFMLCMIVQIVFHYVIKSKLWGLMSQNTWVMRGPVVEGFGLI